LEKELNELKAEKQEILKNYKSQVDDIHKMTEEKYKILEDMDAIAKEKERFLIEKGKLEIQIERLQLGLTKDTMYQTRIEEEKKHLEDLKKELEEKVEVFTKEKVSTSKEIEIFKLQSHNMKLNLEKVTNENKTLQNEIKQLKVAVSENSSDGSVSLGAKKKSSPKNINTNINTQESIEIANLKNELKVTSYQK